MGSHRSAADALSKPVAHVATFVAPPQRELDPQTPQEALAAAGLASTRWRALGPNAGDAFLPLPASALAKARERLRAAAAHFQIDVILQPAARRWRRPCAPRAPI